MADTQETLTARAKLNDSLAEMIQEEIDYWGDQMLEGDVNRIILTRAHLAKIRDIYLYQARRARSELAKLSKEGVA